MTISWFGHSCFRIEAKEGNILTDPFSKDIGLKPPKIKDDLVLVSHNHYDHNNIGDAPDGIFIIKNPGEYEKNGVAVLGIHSYHDKSEGKESGPNTIYIIRAEDMTICHLGDLGQEKLTEKQVQDIGDVDILMIPVGGNYTIDYKEALEVVSQIEPKIVIPMHYKVKNLNIDIDGVDKFVKGLGLTPEKVDKLKIIKKSLPNEEVKLILFASQDE
ncbi:MAG: hypothetical protein COV30_00105 [Candidatus Yanofskybacteria bacterium CG10_big_fil_rev_8_21_14_0_10_37_15]|uniref:Lactamase n=1 Tax=Candidatus Yanofskybacteria bacterium CG10_big_fil_rev_8_21_14_0_10_37_15 TaxID=1975097 RepID=A0A2H0R6G9_9BACT|nr:MAG: hypothetical protein COV30_00105 [Candidatus Yanofskybacteria bacterium CG10_big_fil_rev_8_21_14_0_10_37_15]